MLSPVATLSAKHPAQRAIAVAISSSGTHRRISAVHNSVGCSGYERTMRGHRESVEDDPELTQNAICGSPTRVGTCENLIASNPCGAEGDMFDRACQLLVVAGFVTVSASFAAAAPPASCAHKFVGTWVYAGGTTVIAPGGTAYPKCAMCVPTQTWTCQGNTYLFSNSGPPGQFSATLSPDGRQLIGGGVVATRVGGAARVNTKPPEAKSQTKVSRSQPVAPPDPATRKSASCSDITGTSSKAPAATHCKDANRALKAARVTRKEYPAYSADQYKKAAASARSAGDTSLELTILREASAPPVADKSIDNPERSDLREAFTYIKAAEAIEQNDATCAGLTVAAENYFVAGRIFLQAIKTGTSNEEVEKSYEFSKSNEMFRKRDALNELVDRAKRENRCHAKIAGATTTPPGDLPSVTGGETKEHCDKGLAEMARLKAESEKSAKKYKNTRGVCGPLGVLAIELASLGCVEPDEELPPGKRGCGQSACRDTKAKWRTENRSASEIAKGLAAAGCGEVK